MTFGGGGRIRVLVVDDEALIRTGFQHILDAAGGIETVAAVCGGRALQAVRELRPDVVLLDIRMPDVDGLTVLAGIRRRPARWHGSPSGNARRWRCSPRGCRTARSAAACISAPAP